MKALLLTALSLIFIQVHGTEDPTATLRGVVDLTPETFDIVVNGKTNTLVEFYAPWCGHCKRLTPVLKELGEKVASDPKLKSRVIIAKVNADQHQSLAKAFAITGFPSLKWFPRGEPRGRPENYHGGRTVDDFLKFVNEKLDEDKSFGRVDALDAIVKSFLTGDADAIIEEVKMKVNELSGDDKENGATYLKIMEKVKEKGKDYLETERSRITKMIDSGSLHPTKIAEFSRKVSILSAFLPEQ